MPEPQTMFDRIWQRHAIMTEQDETLLYVARCVIHEGSRHTFDRMRREGRRTVEPDKIFGFSDHYVPTTNQSRGLDGIGDPKIRNMIELLAANCGENGIRHFDMGDPDQGILHVAGPEQGISLPGVVLVGADSHTATHGAFGNLSFGAGASEIYHIMVTQTLWQRKPKSMRILVDGQLPFGVSAKDVILAVIAKIGHGGAAGHVVEYAGEAIRGMTMEQRMTVCNMSIEAGGRAGMIAPDDKTYAYLSGRPYAPRGQDWNDALRYWRGLPSDADAAFDTDVSLNAADIAPMVTWGTNPEHALPITARVPRPDDAPSAAGREEIAAALDYMDLEPGAALTDIEVDRVFIGSCTNSRIEDLRAAAEVARLGRAKVPAWIVPGSATIKRNAEAEGLDRVFTAAGFEWRDPGCSLCTAINGDILEPGERCASTSNRNFKGRQGLGGRTHLVGPAMAAAAAITGKLTDVRSLAKGS
ncbi:MAG: 3-isopropylmalate dehydratase large subunit [Pseudomonadota bacterium]